MLLRGDMTKRAEKWPVIGWWWHHPSGSLGLIIIIVLITPQGGCIRPRVWVCSPTKWKKKPSFNLLFIALFLTSIVYHNLRLLMLLHDRCGVSELMLYLEINNITNMIHPSKVFQGWLKFALSPWKMTKLKIIMCFLAPQRSPKSL